MDEKYKVLTSLGLDCMHGRHHINNEAAFREYQRQACLDSLRMVFAYMPRTIARAGDTYFRYSTDAHFTSPVCGVLLSQVDVPGANTRSKNHEMGSWR